MKEFPKEALAQHIAVLGKTGSGKSYAVRGIVEGLLDDNARVCIIDPTGAWNGLRSSATGKSAGYPVVIFGGSHADLTLAAQYGEAIAETIGTSSTPAIIDTSLMRVSERTRFFADFADALIRKNKGPLHLVIDEAHLFAPQGKVNSPQAGEMLSATNNLVSLGRSRGLRVIMITQRPAKLHKDSLTQCETLVALRLIAPQDRNAVREWIEDNADKAKGQEIISSLASLKTGQGWVWAPELGILDRITFPKIRTFDSGRAPDGSESQGQVLAPIDKEAISAKLQAVKADALANDPTTLKKRIAELERQIKGASAKVSTDDLKAAEQRGFDRGWNEYSVGARKEREALKRDAIAAIQQVFGGTPIQKPQVIVPSAPVVRSAKVVAPVSNGNGSGLSSAARKILSVLSQYPEGCQAGKITLLTGYRYSGSFQNALSELRTAGCIEGANTEVMKITPQGESHGPFPELPQGDDLVNYWLNHPSLSKAARMILGHLSTGERLTAEELCKATGYSYSGSFQNALSELRTAGVLVGRNTDAMRISPEIVP